MDTVRAIEPVARDVQGLAWRDGRFDTGWRPRTRRVEGRLRCANHLLLATVASGARGLAVRADCGHRYSGPEFTGAVSFVPAGRERHLGLEDVASRWASLELAPALFEDDALGGTRMARALDAVIFTNARDGYLGALLAEMARLQLAGELDAAYCTHVAIGAAWYLRQRYGVPADGQGQWRLPRWRLRRIDEYIDAHLAQPVRIGDLARVAGISEGHLHRCFREALGMTPLAYLQRRRVERAMQLLSRPQWSVQEVAWQVGFQSVAHFGRVFRRLVGVPPAAYRARHGLRP